MNVVLDDDSTLSTGAVLPRPFGPYTLLYRLGRGGMGLVYLARAPGVAGIDQLVVVKTVAPEHAADPAQRTRLLDEARVAVRLSHKNIAPVVQVGEAEGMAYLTMEYVQGRDVRKIGARLQETRGRMPPALAIRIVTEVLEALDAAHRLVDPETGQPHPVVHRDVSPQNVMVSFAGEVRLIDFGLAAPIEETAQGGGEVLGKLFYMSPEQAFRRPVDARSDVFAAGVLLYELLAGERFYEPLSAPQVWVALADPAFAPRRLAALEEPVAAVVRGAVALEPAHRFKTAEAMRRALVEAGRATRRFAEAGDLRAFMETLFQDALAGDRELIARFRGVGTSGPIAASPPLAQPPALSGRPFDDEPTEQIRLPRGASGAAPALRVVPAGPAAPVVYAPASGDRGLVARSLAWGVVGAAIAGALAIAVLAGTGRLEAAPPAAIAPPAAVRSPPALAEGVAPAHAIAPPDAVAPAAAVAPAEEAAQVEEAAPTVEEPPSPAAGPKRPAPRPKPVVAKPRTLSEALKALQRCKARQPCAKHLLARKGDLASGDADLAREFSAAVDRCVAACAQ